MTDQSRGRVVGGSRPMGGTELYYDDFKTVRWEKCNCTRAITCMRDFSEFIKEFGLIDLQ